MQTEILEKQLDAELRVIAVWMPLVRGDARDQWDPELLNDPRVSYFWDEERLSGNWFSEHISGQQPLSWDSYFLYGPGATWSDEGISEPVVSTGYTIISKAGQLDMDLARLLQ